MAPWVKAFAAQPEDLSSLPEPHTVEENPLLQLVFGLPHATYIKEINVEKGKRSWQQSPTGHTVSSHGQAANMAPCAG